MGATTHEEVYRPFQGRLRRRALRFWPVLAAGIRVACKKKMPLLLVYAVPAIATIIFAFIVYLGYAAEQAQLPEAAGGGNRMVDMLAKRALRHLQVRNQIAQFASNMQFFGLIPAAWFGAGLFAEDFRVGAHQLYFSRPLTRLDYFLGKFLTASFFTACAIWLPCFVICLVASFASPDWEFLKEEGDVLLWATLYSLVWVTFTSSAALCVSSIAPRKIFALLGFFGLFMIPQAFGLLMGEILEDVNYRAISPMLDILQVSNWMFDLERGFPGIDIGIAWKVLAGLTVAFLGVVTWRLRRLEVVA